MNNLFKFINGKFIVTEGYGSVRKLFEQVDNIRMAEFFLDKNINFEQAQKIINIVQEFFKEYSMKFDKQYFDKQLEVVAKNDTTETSRSARDTYEQESEAIHNHYGGNINTMTDLSLILKIGDLMEDFQKDESRNLSMPDAYSYITNAVKRAVQPKLNNEQVAIILNKSKEKSRNVKNGKRRIDQTTEDIDASKEQLKVIYKIVKDFDLKIRDEKENRHELIKKDKPGWDKRTGERISKPLSRSSLDDRSGRSPNFTDDDIEQLMARYGSSQEDNMEWRLAQDPPVSDDVSNVLSQLANELAIQDRRKHSFPSIPKETANYLMNDDEYKNYIDIREEGGFFLLYNVINPKTGNWVKKREEEKSVNERKKKNLTINIKKRK